MEVISLQSGSSGNCVYVEAGGRRLLFDAGISARQAELRLAQHGRDIRDVDALIISHDHRDHVTGMGVFHRKFGLPVVVSKPTLKAVQRSMKLGRMDQVQHFRSGDSIDFGDVVVETIQTPHDAADGVAFVVQSGGVRFGLLTDLGHVFDGLDDLVGSLDGVLIESNFDPAMLDAGGYPDFLKRRISGPHGHLSNHDAAELLSTHASDRLRWACLGHLSENNNEPEIAIETHRSVLGNAFEVFCADRGATSAAMSLATRSDAHVDRGAPHAMLR